MKFEFDTKVENVMNFRNSFVSLLSTGLDSPIASYLLMNQGLNCISLSFLNGGENSYKNKEKILQVGKRLVELTNGKLRMHFVNYDDILETFRVNTKEKILCILCKRNMIRTAVKLCTHYKSPFIANGDILGEQASQTLDNIFTIHQVNKKIPVLRPLIGFNKSDVIKLSQDLGFYDLSLLEDESCGFNPKFPETRSKISDILHEEEKIDFNRIEKLIFEHMDYIDL